MKTLIRALAAALLAVVTLPVMAHAADDSRFDARALALSSESLLAEPALGSPEVAELVAGEVYQARSEVTPGANGWGFHELAVGDVTGYALEGTVAIIPAPEDPASEDLTKRALVISGGPVHAYPHPDAAPVAQVGTGDTVYTDPSNVVEVSRFLSTETLIPAETTDGTIGWLPENSVQITGERDEDDVSEPAEEPAEDETSEPTTEDPAADEATDEPGDDSPVPVDEEGDSETDGAGSEAFTVLGRELTDPVLLGAAAGALLIVALGWAALRRRGGGRGAGAAASVPVTAPVVEPEIEELVYDDGEDDVEELVYDVATPTTARDNEDRFEF